MADKRIEILEDVDNKIVFEEIKTDTIDREEVALVDARIAELEEQKLAIEAELAELRARIDYAKKVIAIADAKKLAEESVVTEEIVVTQEVAQ
jgi:hypothetical protein